MNTIDTILAIILAVVIVLVYGAIAALLLIERRNAR